MGIDLDLLEKRIDEWLESETEESIREWLLAHRQKLETSDEALHIGSVVKSLPNDDEIEQAANDNADRIFGDDIGNNTKWYAMQHGFTDGVEWIKNHLAK